MSDARVTGAAVTAYGKRRDGSGWRDWALEAFQSALARATLSPGDIDGLFLAVGADAVRGLHNPAQVLAGDLGLIGAAVIRVGGGGAAGQLAVHAACDAINAGRCRHVAVIGVDASASGGTPSGGGNSGVAGGIGETALFALSWRAFAAETGADDSHLTRVTIQNHRNAASNPGAHSRKRYDADDIGASAIVSDPYRRLHCATPSDGAGALILSARADLPDARRTAPLVAGIGAAVDHEQLGARRDPGRFAGKTRAMQRACDMARITPGNIGLAELYDSCAGAQLQALVALGLSGDVVADLMGDGLSGGRFAPGGDLPVNLSGGLMGRGAPLAATGVGQTATCALLLEGRFDGAEPARPARYALADSHDGIATLCAVTILRAP